MKTVLYLAATLLMTIPVFAQDLPSIEEKTEGLEKKEGFFPVYWDNKSGSIWLEIGLWDTDFLYVSSLPAGLGSNDAGLDRGQLRGQQVVHFKRVGPKVLLMARNLDFRAVSDNADERKAVEDAFAPSVVWGFTAAAASEDRILVDATKFIVRDAVSISRRLSSMGQGSFRLEASRSAPYLPMLKAFPENTEMEAQLTFLSDNPGRFVRDVAADPNAITLRVRQSFVKLPELGSYTPRAFDPRSSANGIQFVDYATAINEPKERRYTVRHRLEKKDPSAAVSEAVEPIVYYLDRGTPEPIRSALLDGARWWAEAFEAAGFKDAYRVEMMPEGADPMDLRYNVIQWVHRATRGWSYGMSVRDPRTGEILKGHVTLGSLRVRQDYLIAEGLLAPYNSEETRHGLSPENDPMLEMALARLRQLSAHEIGHTLGFMHNFSSSVNDRASVMDYPAPKAMLNEAGDVVLNEAYDTGIGEWDKVAVRFSYTQFPEGTDEKEGLDAILEEARANGLEFISDTDARPVGGAHPRAHLWDNGEDPLSQLDMTMNVRQTALSNFGLANIPENRPLTQLEEVLVPLYLHHRFQVEAAVKLIGGVDYSYAVRGDANPLPEAVPAERQLAALDALLETMMPEALSLPSNIRTQLPPRVPGYGQHRELFDGHTGLIFDPYAPAQIAASMVTNLIIHPERAARLIYQKDFDSGLPGLESILSNAYRKIWRRNTPRDPYLAELLHVTQLTWTDGLMRLATDANAATPVRARVLYHLREILVWLESSRGRDSETIAHRDFVYDEIRRLLDREFKDMEPSRRMTTPPGSPIGQDGPDFLRRHEQRRTVLDRWMSLDQCGTGLRM